ncbi:MAG: glycosyltransferase [Nanobdellota archaeon]
MDLTIWSIVQWLVYFVSLYFCVFWILVFVEYGLKDESGKKTSRPRVTIAVPAYNEEKSLAPTIESAINLDYPKDKLEIILVNDGSEDKTLELMRKYEGGNVSVVDQKNQGKGAALNTALYRATGEYFVCLDADSEAKPDALDKMIPDFSKERVAAVLPLMKVKNPKNYLQKFQWYEYLLNIYYKKLMGFLDCIHVAPGPFSAYKTEVLKKEGGFETDNLTEDLEMAIRLQKKHYRLIQNMSAEVYTVAPENFRKYYNQRNRWFKGGLFNALKYKEMLFNARWGDFGMIQLPILIISGVIAIILMSTLTYNFLEPYVDYMFNMNLVNFDFMTFIKDFTPNLNLLDVNISNILILVVMVSLSIFMLYMANSSTREKTTKYGVPMVISFVFFYFLLLSVVWFGLIKDLVTRRVQKW